MKNSIKTFGLTDPIIINLNNHNIIGGHQRYDVLIDILLEDGNLSEKEFDLIEKGDIGFIFDVENLILESEDKEKALNIALNKISGSWDYDKLSILLEDLDLSAIDVTLTGFETEDIEIFKLENDIVYHNQESLEELYNNKQQNENSENYEEDENIQETYLEFNSITILFDSEEELRESFDKLVKEGYNCRMSKS